MLRAAALVMTVLRVPGLPADEGKFVLFVREGGQEMVASAWEFDPAKPDAGVVRRAEFARSPWSADSLFSRWMATPDFAPEYVRLQVPHEKTQNGYSVHLYRIDYRTWDVKLVLKTIQAHGLGANARDVFVATDQGNRILDRATGAVREFEKPFRVIRHARSDLWIIELLRQPTGRSGAFFDVTQGRILDERFLVPPELEKGHVDLRLSPDRRRLAFWDYSYSDDPNLQKLFEGRRVLSTKLHVHDLDTGAKRSFAFRSVCSPGSGELVLSQGAMSEWSEDGKRLTCMTLAGEKLDSPAEQVVLDAATMEVLERRKPPEPKRYTSWEVKFLPDYMKADYDSVADASDEHGRRVAVAFLKSREIDVSRVKQYKSDVGFSSDGKRMLIRMPESEGFYFGDLEANTLRLIPTPPALAGVPMDVEWR